MVAIAQNCGNDEIGWLGTVSELGNGQYLVDGIYMPAQQVHGATCELSEDGLGELMTELASSNFDACERMHFWGHVHPSNSTSPSPVVFLLVDSMDVRKDIWNGALKFKLPVEFMIETRMAIDNRRVYAIRPSNPGDIRLWEGTLYSDEEAEESPCTNRAIAQTVSYIASLAE